MVIWKLLPTKSELSPATADLLCCSVATAKLVDLIAQLHVVTVGLMDRAVLILPTLVHKNSEPELYPLRRSQPVQLVEERSDMVVPRRRENKSCGRVHD